MEESIKMALEQEIKVLFLLGFVLIMAIVTFSIFLLWRKSRNPGLIWFIPQLALLSLCILFFKKLIDNARPVPAVMLSEENSLMVAYMGVSWGFSMIFMVIAITKSLKKCLKSV
jgi:hypothetical protein